jgi:hypothetical protein
MDVNHYDDLDMKILSLGRSYKAPSFTSNTYHVKINL